LSILYDDVKKPDAREKNLLTRRALPGTTLQLAYPAQLGLFAQPWVSVQAPLRAQTQLSFSHPQSSQTPSFKSSHRLVSNVARSPHRSSSQTRPPPAFHPSQKKIHSHSHHRSYAVGTWPDSFRASSAELGMTDHIGGPSSPNCIHRFCPENFEEDEEQSSDGRTYLDSRCNMILVRKIMEQRRRKASAGGI
jgi:hypothetical protein